MLKMITGEHGKRRGMGNCVLITSPLSFLTELRARL